MSEHRRASTERPSPPAPTGCGAPQSELPNRLMPKWPQRPRRGLLTAKKSKGATTMKKYAAILLLAILTCMLAGCSAAQPEASPTAPASEPSEAEASPTAPASEPSEAKRPRRPLPPNRLRLKRPQRPLLPNRLRLKRLQQLPPLRRRRRRTLEAIYSSPISPCRRRTA